MRIPMYVCMWVLYTFMCVYVGLLYMCVYVGGWDVLEREGGYWKRSLGLYTRSISLSLGHTL